LARQDKLIAWFLLVQAVAGTATAIWAGVNGAPATAWLVLSVASIAAAVAGILSLQGRPWGRGLGALVFLIQIPSFHTPWFFYAVWLGIHLNISFGWKGTGEVGINLLALAMFLWALFRSGTPNNSSKPTPLRGAA
jgi:hypothetical protein